MLSHLFIFQPEFLQLWNKIFSLMIFFSTNIRTDTKLNSGHVMNKFHIYEPNSVDKMADFETLTLCISKIQVKSALISAKTFSYRYCLYLVKHSILNRFPFSNEFYYPHFVVLVLTSSEIRV